MPYFSGDAYGTLDVPWVPAGDFSLTLPVVPVLDGNALTINTVLGSEIAWVDGTEQGIGVSIKGDGTLSISMGNGTTYYTDDSAVSAITSQEYAELVLSRVTDTLACSADGTSQCTVSVSGVPNITDIAGTRYSAFQDFMLGHMAGITIVDSAASKTYQFPMREGSEVVTLATGQELGADIVTNGDFNSDTAGWDSLSSAILSSVTGRLRVENNGANWGKASQTLVTEVGASYLLTLNSFDGNTSVNPQVRAGTTSGGVDVLVTTALPEGNYSLIITASTTTTYLAVSPASNVDGEYCEFDNIVVRKLPEDRGAELVTNGTFDTDISDWLDISSGTGSIAWSATGGGTLHLDRVDSGNRGTARYNSSDPVAGNQCEIKCELDSASTGNLTLVVNGSIIETLTPGDSTVSIFTSDGDDSIIFYPQTDASDCYLDNVSIKKASPAYITYTNVYQDRVSVKPDDTLQIYNYFRGYEDGSLGEGEDCSRSSIATYTDSDGVIQTAAVDEVRWETIGGEQWVLGEGAITNLVLNSDAPATQTVNLASTGDYTLWVNGTGSAALAANTATLTGAGSATDGVPITINVSGTGTVDITVTGSLDRFQLEKSLVPSSFILTAGSAASRSADVLRHLIPDEYRPHEGMLIKDHIFSIDFADIPNSTNLGIVSTSDAVAGLLYFTKTAGGVGYLASTDGTTVLLLPFEPVADQAYTFILWWDAALAQFQFGYKTLGGTLFTTSAEGAYDGGFPLGAHLNAPFTPTYPIHSKNLWLYPQSRGLAALERLAGASPSNPTYLTDELGNRLITGGGDYLIV